MLRRISSNTVLTFELDSTKVEQGSYFTGNVHVELPSVPAESAIPWNRLLVRLVGVEHARIRGKYIDDRVFINTDYLLFNYPLAAASTDHEQQLYTFPFSIRVAESLPPSFSFSMQGEGNKVSNSRIQYQLIAMLESRMGEPKKICKRDVTVKSTNAGTVSVPIDMDPVRLDVNTAVFHDRGSILLGAALDSNQFFPGASVKVKYTVRNCSTCRINSLEAYLIEEVEMNGHERIAEERVELGHETIPGSNIPNSAPLGRSEAALLHRNRDSHEPTPEMRELLLQIREAQQTGQVTISVPASALPTFQGQFVRVRHRVKLKVMTPHLTSNPKISHWLQCVGSRWAGRRDALLAALRAASESEQPPASSSGLTDASDCGPFLGAAINVERTNIPLARVVLTGGGAIGRNEGESDGGAETGRSGVDNGGDGVDGGGTAVGEFAVATLLAETHSETTPLAPPDRSGQRPPPLVAAVVTFAAGTLYIPHIRPNYIPPPNSDTSIEASIPSAPPLQEAPPSPPQTVPLARDDSVSSAESSEACWDPNASTGEDITCTTSEFSAFGGAAAATFSDVLSHLPSGPPRMPLRVNTTFGFSGGNISTNARFAAHDRMHQQFHQQMHQQFQDHQLHHRPHSDPVTPQMPGLDVRTSIASAMARRSRVGNATVAVLRSDSLLSFGDSESSLALSSAASDWSSSSAAVQTLLQQLSVSFSPVDTVHTWLNSERGGGGLNRMTGTELLQIFCLIRDPNDQVAVATLIASSASTAPISSTSNTLSVSYSARVAPLTCADLALAIEGVDEDSRFQVARALLPALSRQTGQTEQAEASTTRTQLGELVGLFSNYQLAVLEADLDMGMSTERL